MTVAIQTYFIGPTNVRGSRIKARSMHDPKINVTLYWEHGLSAECNHDQAAFALATKMGWGGKFVKAGGADGSNIYARFQFPHDIAFTIDA
jgi:hypothetical protein